MNRFVLYLAVSTDKNKRPSHSGLEHRTGDWVALGSNPAGLICFRTLALVFTPLCHCLQEETLKAAGPLYTVSTVGEVTDPTQGVNV